nr:MAG TPA: hypothetical protein [Crassvirales sp.]DAN99822.1 MAG TPA: hypothetical protein [Caudoviricetes sp.]DAU82846.1 MAG TPA: hypothetical protein [Herelleviridae sp.]DAO67928.1 MAG TPA: hypothetical protein [Caudoviricetes sp.]DAP04881.1 MAG TPA: hypothetical protein [Caudoviricetes sp.]
MQSLFIDTDHDHVFCSGQSHSIALAFSCASLCASACAAAVSW